MRRRRSTSTGRCSARGRPCASPSRAAESGTPKSRSAGGGPSYPAKNPIAAGAKVVRPLADQFYGDRSGTIQDPFGHVWIMATKKEQLAAAEIQRRYERMMQQA